MYFIELDDVGVAEVLEDADLASDAFDVRLLHNFVLLQGLDCNFLLSQDMHTQAHLPKSPLSDALG